MTKLSKKWIKSSLVLSLGFITSFFWQHSVAMSLPCWLDQRNVQAIVTLGAGFSKTNNLGQYNHMPIRNPISDEFYKYSVHRTSESPFMMDIFAGAEWNVNYDWMMQTGLEFKQTPPRTVRGKFLQGADVLSENKYHYHYNVFSKQFLVEGKLLYNLTQCFHPYALAGAGISFNNAYHYYTNVPPLLTFTRMYKNYKNTTFTYAVGLGADADVACGVRVGLGYRFADLGGVKLGHAKIDTTSVSGTLSQPHFYVNEILAQVTFIL